MKKIIIAIFLLACFAGEAQGPGKFRTVAFTGAYSGSPVIINVFRPSDSTTNTYGGNPLIIHMEGQGQVDHYLLTDPNTFASGSIGDLCNRGATMRFRDTIRHIWVQFAVFSLYKASGEASGSWQPFKVYDAIKYAKANAAAYNIDTNRIYIEGLSLGGGGVWGTVADGTFNTQIAAAAAFSGTQDASDANLKTGINASGLHVLGIDCQDDGNSSTSGTTSHYYYVQLYSGPISPAIKFLFPQSGNHAGGWQKGSDTGHAVFSAATIPSGTNVSTTYNPNTYEWFLNYATSGGGGGVKAPSCTTNNTTTSITSTSATVNWNTAATATSYNLYVGGSLVGTTSGTTYNLTGLTASTTYSFYVIPTNSGGAATGCSGSATTFTTASSGGGGGTPGSHILVGYINTTPGGDFYNACTLGSSSNTTAVYTSDGALSIGDTLTNSTGGSLGIASYTYFAFAPTSGAASTTSIQIYSAGTIGPNGTHSCSGGGGGGGGGGVTLIPYDTTGLLTPAMIFNMNNGFFRGGYSYPVDRLFAGLANNGGLPIHGGAARIKRQTWTGNDSTWMPGKVGLTFVLDLIADTNQTKLSAKDTITGIVWREENNYNPKDSAYFYAIDTVIAQSDKNAGFNELNRPDSLLTPFAVLPMSNRSQWDSVSVSNVAARYVLMRIPMHDSTGTSLGVYTFASPGAIKIKGKRSTVPITPFVYSDSAVASVALADITGVNQATEVDDTLSRGRKTVRGYALEYWFDTTRTQFNYATRKYTTEGLGGVSSIFKIFKSLHNKNHNTMLSIRGSNLYVANAMPNPSARSENGIPISEPYQSPESFYWGGKQTYGAIANYWKELVRKLGNGTTTDSSHWQNDSYFPGLNTNTVTMIDPWNEGQSEFNANQTPASAFAEAKAIHDSVMLVDPNMQIGGPSITSQDVEYYKAFWWLTQTFGNKDYLIKNIHYHQYYSRVDEFYINSAGVTAYHKGEAPERDSAYQANRLFIKTLNTLFKGKVQFIHGEGGWEEHDSSGVFNGGGFTLYSTPRIQNRSIGTSRAIMYIRQYINDWAAGINSTLSYTIDNPSYIPMDLYTGPAYAILPSHLGNFSQMGYGWGDTALGPYNGPHQGHKTRTFFVDSFMTRYFTGYVRDTVYNIGYDTKCEILAHKIGRPDSLLYIQYWGTDSLDADHSNSRSFGTLSGTPSTLVFGDSTYAATVTSTSMSGNNVVEPMNAMPKFILMQLAAGSPPSCTTNLLPTSGSTVAGMTSTPLSWNAAAGATSYQVWIDGVLVTAVGGTTYNAFGFTAATTHSWYIVPTNASGAATGCSGSAFTFTTHAVVVSSGKKLLIRKH